MNSAVEAELDFPWWGKSVDVGSLSPDMSRRVQEWLCLNGQAVEIDGDPGPATRAALERFQALVRADDETGYLGRATWLQLVKKMTMAFDVPRGKDSSGRVKSLRALVKTLAGQHLAQGPRMVGDANGGPWWRAYLNGHDAQPWRWRAGFACTVFAQAMRALGRECFLPFSLDCEALAYRAKALGRLVTSTLGDRNVEAGDLFLCGEKPFHVGIVTMATRDWITTVEANGAEIARHTRATSGKRFILLHD